MYKLLSTFVAVVFPVWVAAQEMAATEKHVETVNVIYVVIFGMVFVGMIAGFFLRLWLNERKNKEEQNP
jgi:hypothetical protein